jgi:hypothetical protein
MLDVFWGMGRVTVMNGSNVIDYILHLGHVTLDLYCPVIKSTMIDWFLFIWAIQLYRATTLSFFPLFYIDYT